jgi:hypothetical protein
MAARPPTRPRPRSTPAPAPAPGGGWTWPALMRRVFDGDVLACPRCGGRLRVIAIGQDPGRRADHPPRRPRALSTEAPGPAPPCPCRDRVDSPSAPDPPRGPLAGARHRTPPPFPGPQAPAGAGWLGVSERSEADPTRPGCQVRPPGKRLEKAPDRAGRLLPQRRWR